MKKYIYLIIFLSLLNLVFSLRTNNFFSTDDFFVLAYFKNHNLFNSFFDLLVNGDLFGFRKVIGFLVFGSVFKIFGANYLSFDLLMFVIHTINLLLLFLVVRKLTKNDFASFFVSIIFNKNYLFYYSNIHEVLVFLFCFLTIFLFLEYPKRFYLSFITYVLALLTKETAVTLPFALYALSFFRKINRRNILYLLFASISFGFYNLYFFVPQKVLNPNVSYKVSVKALDILNGLLFYINYKVLILAGLLPILTKKYKYVFLFFVSVVSLIPASILVNRRELYYLYLPFGYLLIYIGLFLPKISFRSLAVYVIIFFVFGGRNILPKIAWKEFPSWQKVSIEKVVKKVSSGNYDFSDIKLERDAKLMIETNTTDLFIGRLK
jgi:hypothetical protein